MSVWLEKLNWLEAQQALNSDRTILIPIGARLKEHAYHLPLNNDWIMAEYFTQRVAAQVDVVVIPTIQFGYYPAFVEYAGSVHIQEDTWIKYLSDITLSLAKHGAKKFYFLNTGISTTAPLRELKKILETNALKMDFTDFRSLGAEAEASVQTQSCGSHADEIETSMMMYMAPNIVRIEKAVCDISALEQKGRFSPVANIPNTHYSPTGAWGDPTLATAEKGRIVVEAQVQEIVSKLIVF